MGSSASTYDEPGSVRVARVEYRDKKTGKTIPNQGQGGFKEVSFKDGDSKPGKL